MREIECIQAPLAEVEQADHANDVQPLDGGDADGEPDELAFPRRRKREDRGHEHDRRFDAVASGLYRYGEAVAAALQQLAVSHHARIENLDDTRACRRE